MEPHEQLSKGHMEDWFLASICPTTQTGARGIVAKLNPTFVSCDIEQKTVTLAFPILEWQLNPQNVMHGGLTATAIHFTMETLVAYFAEHGQISMISGDTSYQKPIFKGDVFHVVARITGERNGIFHLQSEAVIPARGVLASSASGIYTVVKGGAL